MRLRASSVLFVLLPTVAVGAALAPVSPAAASPVRTAYGFQAHAYGSVVTAGQAGLRSGRTAFSWVSCTKLAGRHMSGSVASGSTPVANPAVRMGAITSTSETYRNAATGEVGARSSSTVASVDLLGTPLPGTTDVPRLRLSALRTTARAWAAGGRLHTDTDLSTADVDVTGIGTPATGTPLDDLLHGATRGIDGVVSALRDNGGAITVPGLGVVSRGYTKESTGTASATATATALQVRLFGADLASAADDSTVTVGRALARISRSMPAGAMSGKGYGAGVGLLGGVMESGELGLEVLPCRGTGGATGTESLASVDPLHTGVVHLDGLTGRVWGVQDRDHSARAWTEGRLGSFAVGTGDTRVEVRGVVGRAVVSRSRTGRIATSSSGTRFGTVTVGGRAVTVPADRVLVVPGVAELRFGLVGRSTRGISVTAVRVTLLATPGLDRVDLGNAKVAINP